MKTTNICMRCLSEYPDLVPEVVVETIREGELLVNTCKRGHITTSVIQNERFAILFDMGIEAFNQGNFIESIACATSALERFHDWCIQTILAENHSQNLQEYEKSEKHLKNFSERKFGAFIILYLRRFNETPLLLSQRQVSFRNDIIHKGLLPDEEECKKYIEAVFEVIKSNLIRMKELDNMLLNICFSRRVLKLLTKQKLPEIATHLLPLSIDQNRSLADMRSLNINKVIEHVKNNVETVRLFSLHKGDFF